MVRPEDGLDSILLCGFPPPRPAANTIIPFPLFRQLKIRTVLPLTIFLLLALYLISTVSERPPGSFVYAGTRSPDLDQKLANIPEIFPDGGTHYPRPLPPSWPDPWPNKPSVASEWLSAARFPPQEGTLGVNAETVETAARRAEVGLGTHPPPVVFEIPESYVHASFKYFGKRVSGWRNMGLNPGEAFSVDGRPIQVPKKNIYMGERGRWKPPKLRKEQKLPQVQKHAEDTRTEAEKIEDSQRREWVRRAFLHLWENYKKSTWGHDELRPLSAKPTDAFSGWGATIVDALDMLLIMGLEDEYLLARQHVADIDFTYLTPRDPTLFASPSLSALPPLSALTPLSLPKTLPEHVQSPSTIPTFETVIRYLGGLLSAYDLSHDPLMLARARELGDWLLPSVGTRLGFVVPQYQVGNNPDGGEGGNVVLAEAGSLSLEFTRLSQVTGDPIYFNAISRATDAFDNWKAKVRIEGLFPINLSFDDPNDLSGRYTFGGQADSFYEYLIKQHQLLRGSNPQYARMYSAAMASAQKHLIKPISSMMGIEGLVTVGEITFNEIVNGATTPLSWYTSRLDHLTCFAGGMMGLGARLLSNRAKDMETAEQFTNACVWAYDATKSGLAPETMTLWSPNDPGRYEVKQLPNGTQVKNIKGNPPGYHSGSYYHIQRPETIESVLYMYRLTGDRKYQDKGFKMFTSWVQATIVPGGFAHIHSVNSASPRPDDSGVESFVYSETLKYYYLLFSPPTLLSFDKYVFSTEAHPFRIPHEEADGDEPLFWNGEELKMPRRRLGQGTHVQKWARVMQAAAATGWDPDAVAAVHDEDLEPVDDAK